MTEPTGGHTYKRPAVAIMQLFDQVSALAPDRSVASDGILGDARHAAEHSGHNPNADGIVCAIDLTHDPAHGADMHEISEAIRLSHDNRILYVIFDRHIFDGIDYAGAFTWKPYTGSSLHTDHMHVSLRQIPHYYDSAAEWEIGVDNMAEIMVPLPDNYPYTDHKPGDLVPLSKYLQILGHQIFADRSIDQQDLEVDRTQH